MNTNTRATKLNLLILGLGTAALAHDSVPAAFYGNYGPSVISPLPSLQAPIYTKEFNSFKQGRDFGYERGHDSFDRAVDKAAKQFAPETIIKRQKREEERQQRKQKQLQQRNWDDVLKKKPYLQGYREDGLAKQFRSLRENIRHQDYPQQIIVPPTYPHQNYIPERPHPAEYFNMVQDPRLIATLQGRHQGKSYGERRDFDDHRTIIAPPNYIPPTYVLPQAPNYIPAPPIYTQPPHYEAHSIRERRDYDDNRIFDPVINNPHKIYEAISNRDDGRHDDRNIFIPPRFEDKSFKEVRRDFDDKKFYPTVPPIHQIPIKEQHSFKGHKDRDDDDFKHTKIISVPSGIVKKMGGYQGPSRQNDRDDRKGVYPNIINHH